MQKNEEVKYRNTFLKEVIFRVDYASPIDLFNENLHQSVIDCLSPFTNRRDVKDIKVEEMYFNADNVSLLKKVDQFKEWHFGTGDFDFSISKNYLILSVTKFIDFNTHYSHFSSLWQKIIELAGQIILRRVGVRYINHIPIQDPSKEWDFYLNPLIVPKYVPSTEGLEPIRQFNSTEYRTDDSILRFQHGLPNKDYPSKNNNDLFILDYDEYCDIPYDSNQLGNLINSFHNHILDLFQQSILQPLKDIMNA